MREFNINDSSTSSEAPSPPKKKIEEEEEEESPDEEDELELAVFSKDAVVQDKPLMSKLKGVIGVFQIIMVLKGDIEVVATMWTVSRTVFLSSCQS